MAWTPAPIIRYIEPRPVLVQAPGRVDQAGETMVDWVYDKRAMGIPPDVEIYSPTAAVPMVFEPYSTGAGGADDYATRLVQGDIATVAKPDRLYVDWVNGENVIELSYVRDGARWSFVGVRTAWGLVDESWSSWALRGIGFIVMIYMTAGAGGALAGQVGAAAIGAEAAAAYPALAQAVGNAAIGTALNGGDVESAIKGSAIGLVSGFAGDNVARLVDSQAIGRAAAAAAGAAIRGGDIESAVGTSLLTSGLKSGGSMFADAFVQQDSVQSEYGYGTDAGIVPINDGDFMRPTEPLQDFYGVGDPSQTAVFDYAFGGSIDTGYATPAPDSGIVGIDTPVYTQTPPVVIDDGAPGGFGASALDFLTQAAIAAIKVNQAYQASQRPPVRVNTNPASGAPRPTPGGMLVTQNPLTGQVQTARPAVGVPYALGDGRTMINNGDGTFSLITANGQTSRMPYGSGASAAPDYAQWALYGALGLVVVMAVRK